MVDYSTWKDIELSSDEDETHPFIENATLFRLKHEARLQKIEERKNEEFAYECHKASYTKRLEDVQNALSIRRSQNEDVRDLQEELIQLDAEREELKQKEDNMKKKELPWYIDTICHPGFSKTLINASLLASTEELSEEYTMFIKQNIGSLKQFSALETFNDIENFLLSHPELIHRQTLYFLVSYGIKLYLKHKKDKLKLVCRQIVLLLHVLELFKILKNSSKELLISFFARVNSSDKCCMMEFEKECLKVRKLIKKVVICKVNENEQNENHSEAIQSSETIYDPVEVFNSLPEGMQEAFITKDKGALTEILSKMSVQEAAYHMNRCIKSSLWIPVSVENENNCF